MEINFKVRGSLIYYDYSSFLNDDEIVILDMRLRGPEGSVSFDLNFSCPLEQQIKVNGEDVSDQYYSLFSKIQNKTVLKSARHPDNETQAFIAYQNAKFSEDLPFKCSQTVLLAYRAIENNFDFYLKESEVLLIENLKELSSLPSNFSVRRNRYQLYISMSYVLFLIYLLDIDKVKNVVLIFEDVTSYFECIESSEIIPPLAYNLNKIFSLFFFLFGNSSDKKDFILSELLRLTQVCFSKIEIASPFTHIYEYNTVISDYVNLLAYKQALNSPDFSYRGKGMVEIEKNILKNTIRLSEGDAKDRVIERLYCIRDEFKAKTKI